MGSYLKVTSMPMMSMITHFYNHPLQVQEQISYWESLPATLLSQLEFIVIDDCSEYAPTWRPTKLDLKVFRITSDIAWNQPGARNLATFHASGAWAIYADIDQRFHPDPIQAVLDSLTNLDVMTMYYLRSDNLLDPNNKEGKLPCHPNTYLVNLSSFKICGMFDEDFAGHYGYDDLYMPMVWEKNGGKRVILPEVNYFDDLGFGTTNLSRDLSHNKHLAEQKVMNGAKNSTGMLRFEWEPVKIERL
jgi:hypothetical protein